MPEIDTFPVDPSNAEAARAWDGGDGAHWAEHADRYDRSVVRYHERLMRAAAIGATDRVLDVGCGSGQTTRDAARAAAAGEAVGVDLSSALLEHARRLAEAEGVANATFVQADAQIHPFEAASFDVAISRTGAMFFGDPVAAFANIGRALRPRGRLVVLAWQEPSRNEWFASFSEALAAGQPVVFPSPSAPGPFSLADPGRVQSLLVAAGFSDVVSEGTSEPMNFGSDASDAYRFVCEMGFTRWKLSMLDDEGRARALDALQRTLAAHDTRDGVLYDSAAWLITAVRDTGD
jgi:SAM-dependent methyltransferase